MNPFRPLARSLTALAFLAALPALAGKNDDAVKPLKTVVQSVRYGKDLLALKHFGGEEQGKYLLEGEWEKGTEADRKEFTSLFHTLFGKIAFPKVRKNFENLENVTYDEPKVEGDRAEVGSVIVILHPLKKQELKLKYKLVKDKAAWKVVDVAVLGDSMLQGIRDDQVRPLMKEGGWKALLDAMHNKAAELKDVQLK